MYFQALKNDRNNDTNVRISFHFLLYFIMFAFLCLVLVCVVAIPGIFSTTDFKSSFVSKMNSKIIDDTKNDDYLTNLNHGRPPSRNKLTHLLAVVPRRVRRCNDFENAEKKVVPTIPTTNQNNNVGRFSTRLV